MRTEYSWSTRSRSLPGGGATGLSFCTDRRRGGLSQPMWPANTPNNTQGGNEWTCSRCTMSSLLWRGGILAKRQAPAAFPFLCGKRAAKAAHEYWWHCSTPLGCWADRQSACVVVACKSSTKNKGDRNETKSHRGVQDLPGAMHASFLKRDIDEHYMKFIHETQCGCAKGRGTCMAGQTVELAANFSKGRGKCWCRLYLDLSAAFDSILREFLIADS